MRNGMLYLLLLLRYKYRRYRYRTGTRYIVKTRCEFEGIAR